MDLRRTRGRLVRGRLPGFADAPDGTPPEDERMALRVGPRVLDPTRPSRGLIGFVDDDASFIAGRIDSRLEDRAGLVGTDSERT